MSLDALDTAIEEWEAGNADLKRGALDIMKRQRDQILILTARVEELRGLLAHAFGHRQTLAVTADVTAQVAETTVVPLFHETVSAQTPIPTRLGKARPRTVRPCEECQKPSLRALGSRFCSECRKPRQVKRINDAWESGAVGRQEPALERVS